MITIDTLQETIVADLTTELSGEPTFDEDKLAIKVKNAIYEVQRRRNYVATSMTDDEIAEDIEQFYMQIYNVALFDYVRMGADFESSHNESGVNRTFIEREKLFFGIPPFI